MRRILQLPVLCLLLGAALACEPDLVEPTGQTPTAGIRFINAVPDTGAFDFRFIDLVENSAHWNVAFRNNPVTSACVTSSMQVQYKPARAGQRHFRIFMNGSTAAVASQVVKDTTVTLEAGKNYTVMLMGYANPAGPGRPAGAPPLRLVFIEEDVTVADNQVGLRVINATMDALDVSYYPSTGTAPGTPIALNVAPLTISDHVTTSPATIRYNARMAGDASFSLADEQALAGAAAVTEAPGPFDAIPGTTVGGSAVTAIAWPAAVPGTQAPQAAFAITTGSTSLSATATGYARASGSFLSNCFFVGQQITASGFTNPLNNGTSIITAVTATSITVNKVGGTVAEAAAGSRSLTGPRLFTFIWDRRPPRPDGV